MAELQDGSTPPVLLYPPLNALPDVARPLSIRTQEGVALLLYWLSLMSNVYSAVLSCTWPRAAYYAVGWIKWRQHACLD